MKKLSFLLGIVLLIFSLSACGSGSDSSAEPENTPTNTNDPLGETSGDEEEKETEKQESEESNEDDIWTYYDNATWSDDFDGLKTEIIKVVVTDRAPTIEDPESFNASAVGVKFRIENTTDQKFTTYPDQARLVTSTGEQLEYPDMFLSDHLGGEIDKGVIKEGNVIWYLERGNAESIEWIKLEWSVRDGAEDDWDAERKEYEIELQLK